jgi:type II secretory ATPase GspE/PulE/Tfp pilus assembly ATPase PilB-like protein
MPEHVFDRFGEMITQPNGIVIVTGPTGCGKTTTLYSAA